MLETIHIIFRFIFKNTKGSYLMFHSEYNSQMHTIALWCVPNKYKIIDWALATLLG